MSDPNGRHDASAAGDAPVDPDGDRGSDSAPDRPVPEPVTDDVTAELVRDAIEVARGALPVRQFSEKYDTGTTSETNDSEGSSRTDESA